MTQVRVLVHMPTPDDLVERLPEVELLSIPRRGEIPARIRGEVLLTFPWGASNLAEALARGVRWIHTLGTGVDGFPLELVGERVLTCSRGASALPIAEWVLAVMLAFEKRLPDAWIHNPPERWGSRELGGLYGRTLGLLGIGGIGTAVAKRALSFGMRVRALRRSASASPLGDVELATDLPDLLAAADHVVVAAPATPETRHLLGRDALKQVKPGVHLVNIARGSIVDQDALREALDDGRVACASLDAVEPEPLPEGHWLYTHPRVRLSPHISWHMPGALDLLFDSFVENLRRYRAGEPLEGIVDAELGY